MTAAAEITPIDAEDQLRADLYDFLSVLLAGPPADEILRKSAQLSGDNSDLGRAITTLARVAKATNVKAAEREYSALFIGLSRGELLPYASYYLTGFLNEKPLALLRKDMAALQVTRAPNVFEPEDNIASLFEIMAGMILGRFGQPISLAQQNTFFNKHVASWANHFFTDLEAAQSSIFYASVGAVGRAFMDVEKEAFRMTAA